MAELTRFEIRLAPAAEAEVCGLTIGERRELKEAVEGIAELAAMAPPRFPAWFRRRHMALPLMRMQVGDLELSYELDCDGRSLRVCGIERSAAQLSELRPGA